MVGEHNTKEKKGYTGGGWGLEHRPAHPEANGSHAAALIGNEHLIASNDSTAHTELTSHNHRTPSTEDNGPFYCHPSPQPLLRGPVPSTPLDPGGLHQGLFEWTASHEDWDIKEWSHILGPLLLREAYTVYYVLSPEEVVYCRKVKG